MIPGGRMTTRDTATYDGRPEGDAATARAGEAVRASAAAPSPFTPIAETERPDQPSLTLPNSGLRGIAVVAFRELRIISVIVRSRRAGADAIHDYA